MEKQYNIVGIDAEASEVLSRNLNDLLSCYQVFYSNVRGFHWNIKGDKFFELHLKFEEVYGDLRNRIDEIAERILTLGGVPKHTLADFIASSAIKEVSNVSDGTEAVKSIVESYFTIMPIQRKILSISDELNDEGTNSLMSDYITEQEKTVWMFRAFLG